MLEQHQAPITAALTPAFGSDSAPEILASAVEVCAVFVGSGIIKQIEKMSRILRLLGSALEQSRGASEVSSTTSHLQILAESGTLSLGDAGEASPNASVMLRIATLTAWAKLEIASASQSYLLAVVQPHRSILASLWLSALRDYATIRADIEIASQDTSIASMDSSSGGIGRDVLLPVGGLTSDKILLIFSLVLHGLLASAFACYRNADGYQGRQYSPCNGWH
jgi:hypothetical protein